MLVSGLLIGISLFCFVVSPAQRGSSSALFRKNGGVFIKAGQHIAAMFLLLPPEYTQTMAVLQDAVRVNDLPCRVLFFYYSLFLLNSSRMLIIVFY